VDGIFVRIVVGLWDGDEDGDNEGDSVGEMDGPGEGLFVYPIIVGLFVLSSSSGPLFWKSQPV